MAKQDQIGDPDKLVKMWVHECERIYGDRLVSIAHLDIYKAFVADITKKAFPRAGQSMAKFF